MKEMNTDDYYIGFGIKNPTPVEFCADRKAKNEIFFDFISQWMIIFYFSSVKNCFRICFER